MKFDPEKFSIALTVEIRAKKPFLIALRDMINWCANHLPHDDWEKIIALDVSEDEKKAIKWVPTVLKKNPCPFEIQALYFGLAEMANAKDEEYADLYVAFMGQYDSTDKESKWVFGEKRHYPEKANLKVKTLKSAGLIFNRQSGEGLGNDGHFMFSLSYALLLTTTVLKPELYDILCTKSSKVGILAGWDSGDLMNPGELTAAGFIPNLNAMI